MPRVRKTVKKAAASATEKIDEKIGKKVTQEASSRAPPPSKPSGKGSKKDASKQLVVPYESREIFGQPDGKFELIFYMKHFRASDIIVKVVDRHVIIDASHKMHVDEHGLVKRSMFRKHALPESVAADNLMCCFTGHGYLLIQELDENMDFDNLDFSAVREPKRLVGRSGAKQSMLLGEGVGAPPPGRDSSRPPTTELPEFHGVIFTAEQKNASVSLEPDTESQQRAGFECDARRDGAKGLLCR
ncbi:SHSP domain-containing protein [Trichonephila inaurata madagascariensis]|uniref:SHSP domain-containing protein n=1 Tax=Trichonephila inaurata madagascariensis TaxID=2747483 RepID=A0A8X6YV59_9ARAC|nr:SHSP domain-containing protein [Trichonephila inaurata madagascariensis]